MIRVTSYVIDNSASCSNFNIQLGIVIATQIKHMNQYFKTFPSVLDDIA